MSFSIKWEKDSNQNGILNCNGLSVTYKSLRNKYAYDVWNKIPMLYSYKAASNITTTK